MAWFRERFSSSAEAEERRLTHEKMRIAIIGTRGLPPRYGGAETMAEELGKRFAQAGHEVVVYCRYHNLEKGEKPPSEYKGIRLVHLPSINTKVLDSLTHSFLACWHIGFFNTADRVYVFHPGHAYLLPILWLFRKKYMVGIDGADWTRKKWNPLSRLFLRVAVHLSNMWSREMMTDNPIMQEWFRKTYGKELHLLPIGAPTVEAQVGTEELDKQGLSPGGYYLFVGRLIPEKGVHYLLEAYGRVKTDKPLVIVGGSEYTTDYVRKLRSREDPRVRFTGYIYGRRFRQLIANCYVYVQPSEVEGTSPVLLTAMSYGRCVVVNGIPENLCTIGEAGISFKINDADDLARKLQDLEDHPEEVKACGERVRERVLKDFNWDKIAEDTLKVFEDL
jgi:glycosyltransferase involved in cell wall biosynthesis